MARPYHVDIWPDRVGKDGQPEKWTYAAMVDSAEQARSLALEKLPSEWRVEVPDNWPPYGISVVRNFDLKDGEVRRIA